MTVVDKVEVPALCTLQGVDIMASGQWDLSTGEVTFTTTDLAHAVEAAQCPAVADPAIKLGHLDPRFNKDAEAEPGVYDGTPAIGRIRNLALAAQGNKITGDLAGMPGWLAAILPSAYPKRSVEGSYDYPCQNGHVHPFVITGLALLGVTPPGVGVLSEIKDVAALYGVAAAAPPAGRRWSATVEGAMPEQVQAAGVTTEDVRRAWMATNPPWSQWITELQIDPAQQLIVCDDTTAQVYRVPFTIKGSSVTFGEPVAVQVEYVDAGDKTAAARGARIAAARIDGITVTWASHEAFVQGTWNKQAALNGMGDDPSASAIKAMFAIPADTKTDSKLPHHDASDGTVGSANMDGVHAAMAALNGGRGGLAGVSDSQKSTAYSHLAGHYRTAGEEAPDFKGAAADTSAPTHGAYDGTHSHPHSPMGQQGGDATHDHSHAHTGDGSHAHVHAAGASKKGKGGKDVDVSQFTDDHVAALRAALGLADDEELTPDMVVQATVKLAEQAKAEPVAASGKGRRPLPEGMMLVDKDGWAASQERIEKLERRETQRQHGERDDIIASGVRAGKFAAASRDRYVRLWDADPDGTRDLIASMTPNVVPVADVGGAGGAFDEGFDEEYEAVFGKEGSSRG